jgi:serine/threonine protein kinase
MESAPVFSAGTRIANYEVRKYLAKGGSSDIYAAVDVDTEQEVAIKIELIDSNKRGVLEEIDVLRSIQHSDSFPKLIANGATDSFHYLAVSLLGPSLLAVCNALPTGHCSLYTTLHLALEMLKCIEAFHGLGYVHRDIKLSNFLLRPDVCQPVVLTDFGLSRRFEANGRHIERGNSSSFVGTYKYASVHAHEQKQLSRRDDLISWFYSVVELVQGTLRWSKVQNSGQIFRLKKSTCTGELCTNLPIGFQSIWKHLRALRFADKPNYGMIRRVIRLAISRETQNDREWDWEKLDDEVKAEISQTQLPIWQDLHDLPVDDGVAGAVCSCCVA